MNRLTLPRVFIVVLNWKNAPDTLECLESIFKLSTSNFQVVLCDNHSPDDSVEVMTDWLTKHKHAVTVIEETSLATLTQPLPAEVVLIRNERNYGYAGGNNRGLRYCLAVGAKDGFAWIINNDVALDPEALNYLLEAAVKRPEVSFFGSTIFDYSDRHLIQTQGGDRIYPAFAMSLPIGAGQRWEDALPQAKVEQQLGFIRGASVFVRLSAIRQVGLMEERYFLYFEETDWAIRARRQGLRLGYVPGSWIYHKEGATTGSSPQVRRPSPLSDYYGVKNRVVVTRRLYPWWLPTVYLGMLVTIAKRLATGQFDRAGMVAQIMLGIDRPPIHPN